MEAERALRPEISSSVDRRLSLPVSPQSEHSRALFDLLIDENAYYSHPTASTPSSSSTKHVPAFSFNTLAKTALGAASHRPGARGAVARGIGPPTDRRLART